MLGQLPAWLIVPDPAPEVVALLSAELRRDTVGQTAVLDRLLDLLLISTLRRWAETAPARAVWLRSGHDPVVASALAALHPTPEHGWTVEQLARRAGVSRAALAKRFTDHVGTPPVSHLNQRRLALAADLLPTGDTLEAIARQGGYGSAFSLSAAFKQRYGVRPAQYRSRLSSAAPA